MVKTLLVRAAKFVLVALVGYALERVTGSKRSQPDLDHHANQKNPNNRAYKATQDNRANQLNPNNPAYHMSRANNSK